MKNRVITVKLTEESISKAITEAKKYKEWLDSCTRKFIKELGDSGMEIASIKFANAVYDGTNDVSVSVEERADNMIAILAVGNATLFIEFGTGIKYPDTHPEAAANGMVRGEYGHKLGRLEKGWRYAGDPGTNGEVITEGKHAGEVHTYGNPANMCMYQTVREIEEKFAEIARRVFV